MIYVYPILIPHNTPQSNPLVKALQLTAGTITRVNLQYPSGVVALAHVQLSVGLGTLFPTNPDGDFATSNETITWDEEYVLNTGANQITATCWNTDNTFDHTITVRIIMQPLAQQVDIAAEVAALLRSTGQSLSAHP